MATTSSEESTKQPATERRRRLLAARLRLLVLLLVGAALAGGAVYGILWWQERPLRQAAELLDSGDDPRRALELVDEYLGGHPDSGKARALKARALVANGRFAQAVQIYSEVGAESFADMHAWAQALLHLERWGEAQPLLLRLMQIAQNNPEVLHEAAACHARLGWFRESIEAATRLSQLDGYEARGHVLLAIVHRAMENYEQAAKCWQVVLQHSPKADDLHIPAYAVFQQYGIDLLQSGNAADAQKMLERSLKIKPAATTWTELGRAADELGKPDRAAEAWQQAIRLDPGNLKAREGLARQALAKGDGKLALRWLAPVVERDERSATSSAAFLMQRAYVALGDGERAEHWRKRAVEIRKRDQIRSTLDAVVRDSPESFWGQVVQAYRFAEKGNWREAETTTSRLIKDHADEPFLRDLHEAVGTKGRLPSLERLPIDDFAAKPAQ